MRCFNSALKNLKRRNSLECGVHVYLLLSWISSILNPLCSGRYVMDSTRLENRLCSPEPGLAGWPLVRSAYWLFRKKIQDGDRLGPGRPKMFTLALKAYLSAVNFTVFSIALAKLVIVCSLRVRALAWVYSLALCVYGLLTVSPGSWISLKLTFLPPNFRVVSRISETLLLHKTWNWQVIRIVRFDF